MSVAQVRAHTRPGTDDALAIRLRTMRVSADLSQRALSEVTRIAVNRVGHIERASSLPSPAEVSRWTWETGAVDQEDELLKLRGARVPEVIEYD